METRRGGRRMAIVWATFAGTLLLLATSAVGFVSWQSADKLVHPARSVPEYTPEDSGLAYERVRFQTHDGVDLVGWWMPSEGDPAGTVIFLHGYGDSKNQSLQVAPALHAKGYHVLAFDFRAHGESGGTHTTVGLEEVADVQAAYQWLAQRPDADAERVALMGFSMGAATALNSAASIPQVDAIIADSGFATLENIASNSITSFTGLPKYPFGPLSVLFAGWMVAKDVGENAPVRSAASLEVPVLVIQGAHDRIALPDDDGKAIHRASPVGSEYWLVEGASHVAAHRVAGDHYGERVVAFLDARLT